MAGSPRAVFPRFKPGLHYGDLILPSKVDSFLHSIGRTNERHQSGKPLVLVWHNPHLEEIYRKHIGVVQIPQLRFPGSHFRFDELLSQGSVTFRLQAITGEKIKLRLSEADHFRTRSNAKMLGCWIKSSLETNPTNSHISDREN